MSRYYSLETIRANAYDVTLENGVKHRCIDPDALLDIEPADVRENVKGEWKEIAESGLCDLRRCSNCGHIEAVGLEIITPKPNYCPNCGAQMMKEEDA